MYIRKEHLEYPKLTMFQMVEKLAKECPDLPALEFYGTKTSYKTFIKKIEQAARAFQAYGISKGDVVTICMPNVPQALVCFYALNRLGAVANMIHPLSARDEIIYYLNFSKSKMILTVDLFCEKVEDAISRADHPVFLLVARMQEELNPVMAAVFLMKKGKEVLKYPKTKQAATWSKFMKQGKNEIPLPQPEFDPHQTSVILYSGGTTGYPKGICLSNLNMNACALQARNDIPIEHVRGLTILSCMPIFHGFGLGINLHLILVYGGCCILMPTFNTQTYADMLLKKKPNFIAGVPTIFDALLHLKDFEGADLSFLKGMFCGGDALPIELKKQIDAFLKQHGADIQVREGYGLTECVTASCLTPADRYKEGSIGTPFVDMKYAIVSPGTDEVLLPGEEGEIIISGPTVMLGYKDNPEANAETLRVLPDGNVWLYTGDMGHMDKDGFVYFSHRIKRMIITNGYNVYPQQLERAVDSHPLVEYSCIIGVKDPRRMQKVRAYIVLRDEKEGNEQIKESIMEHIRLQIPAYALPREIEFRKELPHTLVGKIDYRTLEEEANKE